MAKRYKLGSSFIGYNKGQVDLYIDSLMGSNAMKLDEIRRRVNDCRSEMDRLNSSLSDKQKEMDGHKKSRKYMDYALKRVESTAGLISAYAESERRELDEAGRTKLDEYDREIERLSEEIKNKQEHLSFLVRRASKPKQAKNANADEVVKLSGDMEESRTESPRKARNFSFWDENSYEDNNAAIETPSAKKESAANRMPEVFQDKDDSRILPR
jgi:chromosome segregation ATPase